VKGHFVIIGPFEKESEAQNAAEDVKFVLDYPEEKPIYIEKGTLYATALEFG
jgi:hypothetical protein